MQVVNTTDKEQLNNFVASQEHSQFLQSWQWGEFQKKVSGKVIRMGVENDNELITVATIIKKFLPMGKSYFYCPRGPIVDKSQIPNSKKILELLFNKIRDLAKNERAMFLRFEPLSKIDLSNLAENLGLKIEKTIDVQPSKTLILDITKPKEELLANMHQKTRYNIKLAKKKGVKIIEADVGHFEELWQLIAETSERDAFRPHGRSYYREMLKSGKSFIKLLLSEFRNKVISAGIFSFFADAATYMHGASSNKHRNVMAPHFLQWHSIKLAKSLGYKYYDFYGINEKEWPGITRFKKGFGGSEIEYPGTFNLVFDQGWYSVYKMVRKIRRTF